MGIKLQGGNNTTNNTNVNPLHQLQVVTPQAQTGLSAGFVQLSTEVDTGIALGTRMVLPPECSDDYRVRVGVDQTIFNSTFEGTTTYTLQWTNSASTFTMLQAAGFFTINANSVVTTGSAGYLRTWRHFPTFGTYPTYLDMWIREGGWDATNAISEWGYLYLTSATTQQPLDGIFFRRISGGQLKGVITTGTSASVGFDSFEIDLDTRNVPSRDGYGMYNPTETNHYLISFHNDVVRFWINDVLVGEIQCPPQLATFSGGSTNLPVGLRVVYTTTSSIARQLSVGYVNVALGDQNTNKPWQHAMVGSGQGSYQTQIGNSPAPTVTRSAGIQGHPTSGTARSTTAWAATTQPGTNSNNLGGLWTSSALSTLASDVDYPLFAYLNPIGTATLPGKTLYVTGVRMGETNITTAPGSTGAFFSYIVQVENSAAATSTTDGATTTSGKATVIGGQGFAPNDPVGTMKPGFEMLFNPPLVVPAGKYCTVVARPFGTIGGGTLVVTGSVGFNGYFE